jgi:eukaryotic-like serine/threonine-protein kinase
MAFGLSRSATFTQVASFDCRVAGMADTQAPRRQNRRLPQSFVRMKLENTDNASKVVKDVMGGSYELLLPKLGRGGQGTVYAVKGGRYAVKILRASSDAKRGKLRRVLNFVKLLPIEDLHLAKPISILAPPQTGYVMEFLSGMVPIKSLMKPGADENSVCDWYNASGGLRRRLQLLGRSARLLGQMHLRGLVYSDPSPDNIFVSDSPDHGEVWFIDTDNIQYVSSPGKSFYTPGYGAPELVSGKSAVNSYSDSYAFSIVAFQVLSLAHPFIGSELDQGPPEMEEKAFAGELPWIESEEDSSNSARDLGIPRDLVLSPRIRKAFNEAFDQGKTDFRKRPSLHQWAKIFFSAAEATLKCPGCSGTFYFNLKSCPWCDHEKPNFARTIITLWDPEEGISGDIFKKPKGDKKVLVSRGSIIITEGEAFELTSRHAFGDLEDDLGSPVVKLSFCGNHMKVSSLDGEVYSLVSPDGKQKLEVGESSTPVPLHKKKSWSLHFGHHKESHRLIIFRLEGSS